MVDNLAWVKDTTITTTMASSRVVEVDMAAVTRLAAILCLPYEDLAY